VGGLGLVGDIEWCHEWSWIMNSEHLSRREFLGQAALAAGVLVVAGKVGFGQEAAATGAAAATAATAATTTSGAGAAAAGKRTASDIVVLGNTGLKVSRMGIGLGSSNGAVQAAGGQEKFNGFIKHAFDNGITMFDTAANYRTYSMMGAAIKGLPREKIFIQSKIDQPDNILDKIDDHRKKFNTDYVDSMLVHIQYRANWLDTWKKSLEDYQAAQEKKWIKARGVSCHSLPALRAAVAHDWPEVHLVRVNPQGFRMDGEQQVQDARKVDDIKPVLAQLKTMGEKKRGVIGMKIFGDGQMKTAAEREASVKFAMGMPEIDSVIIGFSSIDEMDQGIKLVNKVLGEMV
jgi:aryl-alcohol dehydrogenase-like predicted oxidoreductase